MCNKKEHEAKVSFLKTILFKIYILFPSNVFYTEIDSTFEILIQPLQHETAQIKCTKHYKNS